VVVVVILWEVTRLAMFSTSVLMAVRALMSRLEVLVIELVTLVP